MVTATADGWWTITYEENMEDYLTSGEAEFLGFIASYGANMMLKLQYL
jgi:hypothetical protein